MNTKFKIEIPPLRDPDEIDKFISSMRNHLESLKDDDSVYILNFPNKDVNFVLRDYELPNGKIVKAFAPEL